MVRTAQALLITIKEGSVLFMSQWLKTMKLSVVVLLTPVIFLLGSTVVQCVVQGSLLVSHQHRCLSLAQRSHCVISRAVKIAYEQSKFLRAHLLSCCRQRACGDRGKIWVEMWLFSRSSRHHDLSLHPDYPLFDRPKGVGHTLDAPVPIGHISFKWGPQRSIPDWSFSMWSLHVAPYVLLDSLRLIPAPTVQRRAG